MGFLDTLFGTASIDTNVAGLTNQQWGEFQKLHGNVWDLEGNKEFLESSLGAVGKAEDLYESEMGFSADLVQASRQQAASDQFAMDQGAGLTGGNRQASAGMMLSQARIADRSARISRDIQLGQGITQALGMLQGGLSSIGPNVNQYMETLSQMEIAQAQIEQSQGNAIWGAIGAVAGGFAMGGALGTTLGTTLGSGAAQMSPHAAGLSASARAAMMTQDKVGTGWMTGGYGGAFGGGVS